jgi:DNA polymerase-4
MPSSPFAPAGVFHLLSCEAEAAVRTILHVDMNSYFASVEQKTYPFLRGKAIAVCGDPSSRTVVAAASIEAKKFGVKSAMNLFEARQCCPHIIPVKGSPARYIDTSLRLMAIFTRVTDRVEIYSIDEAFLDVTNTAHLFGGAENLARELKALIKREVGLPCSVGIAPNKLLAKLGSDMKKPDGLVVINPENVGELLENLPVRELWGIGEKTEASLAEMGIKTCGDLARFPERVLFQRYGINGTKLKLMGQGRDDMPVMPYYHIPETKSMGHSVTLGKDTGDMQHLQRVLLKLSEMVGRRLRRDGYRGRTVNLCLRYADFTTFGKQKSIRWLTDDGYQIYRLGWMIFKEMYQPPLKVRLIGISVSGLVKDVRQMDLFELEKTLALGEAVDNINDKYGEFTIRRGSLLPRIRTSKVISPAWRPYKQPAKMQSAECRMQKAE